MRRATRGQVVAGTMVLCVVAVTAYHVGGAYGAGIPSPTTLAHSGSLLTFGAPDNSTHRMSAAVHHDDH